MKTKFRYTLMLMLLFPLCAHSQTKDELLSYLRTLGNGKYLFGQQATWVHRENPDMDHPTNWLKKVYDHTGIMPRYGCITYDFQNNPFPDAAWNEGVKKVWEKGIIPGVYTFWGNPAGGGMREEVQVDLIFASGENPVKTNFYQQLDRMAANLKWLRDNGISVVYTPFVELDDRTKWHARGGSQIGIRLFRLVHDYFTAEGLDNIVWAFHTRQSAGALAEFYPGDEYCDVIGKSGYGKGLIFNEYEWAVGKKKNAGKVIWWAELGIRDKADAPSDCMDVLSKLESSYPELAGFSFWSDEGFYNVVGNNNGKELMSNPKIVTMSSGDKVKKIQTKKTRKKRTDRSAG
jgi:hypothetical protein